jgi:hypothetical protein
MRNSKKAQGSDTLSWIVATIVIFLFLSGLILFSKLGFLSPKKVYFDRSEDPIATKSMSGYLLKNYEPKIKLELGGNQVTFSQENDKALESFLFSLGRFPSEGWNFALSMNGSVVYLKETPKTVGVTYETEEEILYPFDYNGKKIIFKFWREGQAG